MNKISELHAKQRERDQYSISSLAELLREVCSNPSKFMDDATLRDALHTQGTLAKYELPTNNIFKMSLNHQKMIADFVLGSYSVLNALRNAAAEGLKNEALRYKRGNVKTKAGILARIQELENDRRLLLQDMFLLQRAFDLRCIQAQTYANAADKATQARCAKEQKEILTSFALRRKHIASSNVSNISEAKQRD